MHSSSLMKFMARSLLHVDSFVTRQLPDALDVQIDSDTFLQAFSFVDESGIRQRVGPWQYGPGYRSNTPREPSFHNPPDDLVSQKDYISEQYNRWEDFCTKYAGHIPYAVAVKPGVRALEGWNSDGVHSKLTSVRSNKGMSQLLTHGT